MTSDAGAKPVVSIVVPVYQTALYLRKCLDSILNQTMPDLEVILVDDGSTDGSADICDEYAACDARVRVIHQENGGRSAARNTGIAAVRGSWVGFVDSDDWIEPDMYEHLLAIAETQVAQIAVCGRVEERPDGRSVALGYAGPSPLSPEDALTELVRDSSVRSYLCDKLFSRKLFSGIEFPPGRNYEDVAVVYQTFDRASRIALVDTPSYHYVFHGANLVCDESLSNRIDYWLSAKERYDALSAKYPRLEPALALDVMRVNAICWSLAWGARGNDRASFERIRADMVMFARNHCRSAQEASEYGRLGRTWLWLARLNRTLAFFFSSLVFRLLDR